MLSIIAYLGEREDTAKTKSEFAGHGRRCIWLQVDLN